MQMHFSSGGAPVLFVTGSDLFEVDFLLATLQDTMSTQTQRTPIQATPALQQQQHQQQTTPHQQQYATPVHQSAPQRFTATPATSTAGPADDHHHNNYDDNDEETEEVPSSKRLRVDADENSERTHFVAKQQTFRAPMEDFGYDSDASIPSSMPAF
eukprot:TRINITY_DN889_c0_g1_i3.p1 TRINITY_DN889_c0_g1~~TRINITY_DN889_c0_g1_i3.p1  ORF type:complete len:156 (+),score=52.94 TRINITY_DN889_c0_g1_i3:288-755(+)